MRQPAGMRAESAMRNRLRSKCERAYVGRADHRRRGGVMIYLVLGVFVALAFSVLAVDWGRTQLAKLELESVADAAGRAACVALPGGATAAKNAAVAVAAL